MTGEDLVVALNYVQQTVVTHLLAIAREDMDKDKDKDKGNGKGNGKGNDKGKSAKRDSGVVMG